MLLNKLRGAIVHSDRGTQYTSNEYRNVISKYGIQQSMNSDGGKCHDNARCESMCPRIKEELIYGRYNTKEMTVEEHKILIWAISSAIGTTGGFALPMVGGLLWLRDRDTMNL